MKEEIIQAVKDNCLYDFLLNNSHRLDKDTVVRVACEIYDALTSLYVIECREIRKKQLIENLENNLS